MHGTTMKITQRSLVVTNLLILWEKILVWSSRVQEEFGLEVSGVNGHTAVPYWRVRQFKKIYRNFGNHTA